MGGAVNQNLIWIKGAAISSLVFVFQPDQTSQHQNGAVAQALHSTGHRKSGPMTALFIERTASVSFMTGYQITQTGFASGFSGLRQRGLVYEKNTRACAPGATLDGT